MEGQRTKNALLFVIALCLGLIVLRLYSSVDLVGEAEARANGGPETHLWGCANLGLFPGTCIDWVPVRTTLDGRVIVAPQ
jgi:hypothetical protein